MPRSCLETHQGSPSRLQGREGGQPCSGLVWGLWHPLGVIKVRVDCLKALVLPGGDPEAGLGWVRGYSAHCPAQGATDALPKHPWIEAGRSSATNLCRWH